MANNNIANLKPIHNLLKLTNLDISDNKITSIKELKKYEIH